MEAVKHLVGESTKEGFFLVVGDERERAIILLVLDSSLFPAPVGEALQFGRNLDQNYKTLYLMILCKDFLNLMF